MNIPVELIIAIGTFALEHGPEAVAALSRAFAKDAITLEDWQEAVECWKKRPEDFLTEARARQEGK
jgi:hypothetical protein